MELFDFVVVGGGITGLSAANRLSEAGQVLVVTKEALAESNTSYAQGGIAVAMGGDEDVALHFEDTITAGDGLVERDAAALLVSAGPERVDELLRFGTAFDRGAAGELERTREGAHSLNRILHAQGDATGREIARALLARVRGLKNVELREWTTTVDLVVEDGSVVGVTLLGRDRALTEVRAKAILLASGGAGQIYSDTTNPAVATGDGIAMAYRAGAAVEDMEFYQFHPTAFAMEGTPRYLMSEALRGEGALLRNARGERFMPAVHPQAELAPRDVVARAITRESLDGPVSLDMRHVQKDLKARFPGISAFLAGYGLELARDLIPVRPAAHYLMGGVKTDLAGRTTLPGLFAAGEAACTGVHGANRLASNSLLEGLVFGVEAAGAMVGRGTGMRARNSGKALSVDRSPLTRSADESAEAVERWIARLRELMWRDAGLLRDAAGLRRAQAELRAMRETLPAGTARRAIEARNLHTLAEVMVASALGREESRGAHFRLDFPDQWPVARHSVMQQGRLWFEQGSLPAEAEDRELQSLTV
jgi:L-aspartate oxidase